MIKSYKVTDKLLIFDDEEIIEVDRSNPYYSVASSLLTVAYHDGGLYSAIYLEAKLLLDKIVDELRLSGEIFELAHNCASLDVEQGIYQSKPPLTLSEANSLLFAEVYDTIHQELVYDHAHTVNYIQKIDKDLLKRLLIEAGKSSVL